MNSQRYFFLIFFMILSLIIWNSWNKENLNSYKHLITNNNLNIKNIKLNKKYNFYKEKNNFITVNTDVLSLKINKKGGDIEKVLLLSYPENLKSYKPYELIKNSRKFIYQIKSGLLCNNIIDKINGNQRPLYYTNKNIYFLNKNKNELNVPMTYLENNGIKYTKTYILKRGKFALNVSYDITNISKNPIKLSLCGQLEQSINLSYLNNNLESNSYRNIAYSTNSHKYTKCNFNEVKKNNFSITTKGGWVAMLQQYFVTSWIPCTINKNNFYTNYLGNNKAIIGFISNPICIKPGNHSRLTAILWIGPKLQDNMLNIAPNLNLVIDYGWLWFISKPLFKLLKFINDYIGNWGFSIIIITFIVRCVMYPITKSQYITISKMRTLQPKIISIRKKFNKDKKRFSKEIISLYKKENINPFGGFLPLFIQMPIFLALYYTLSNSIELRHSPFILWIHDLSAKDPYYILPILMGITIFFIQKTSHKNYDDKSQQKIMYFIPVIFTLFFFWFPSGLVLYYIVNNLINIIQQNFIDFNKK